MTIDEQFAAFWKSYPNRKGKGDARKAFATAIKKTTLETMLSAITKYVANKPGWQAYKHPGPWLRGEHWDDEWEPQQARVTSAGRFPSREEYIAAELRRAERSFQR